MTARTALISLFLLALAAPAPASAYTVSGPATVAETAGKATYTVTRSLAEADPAPVTVAGSGSAPATPGQDTGTPTQAKFDNALDTSTTFDVPINDDPADEADESYTVTVGDATATTTITDDDVTVDVAPATVGEGGTAGVVLTPRTAPAHEMRVTYATVPGPAGAADFTATQGTLTWAAGDASPRTVGVATTQDALDEDDEAFGLLVGSSTDTLSAPAVAVTVTDDDAPPLLGAVPAKIAEGDSGTRTLPVTVRLAVPSGRTVRVPFTTRDGSAKAGSDYTATNGTLTFAPGELTKTVPIRVAGDRTAEPDETFSLDLGTPVNATPIAGGGDATLTIADDDGGGADDTSPRVRLTAPRRSGARVTLTVRCPATESSCRGAVTLFTVANRRSPVSALRRERRLGRATYRLSRNGSRRLAVRLRSADLRLLSRARSVRVRAFAVTTDAAGNVGTTSRTGALRFG